MPMDGRKRRKIGIPAIVAVLSMCLAAGCSAGMGNGCGEEVLRRVYVCAVQEGEVPEPVSRTFIGGEALDRCFWSERDTIGVYYRSADDAGSPVGRAFGCYRAYPGEALFAAEMPAMAEGEYSYYGAYPLPERMDGTSVTWHLPAVQSGRYRGYSENFDFMLAEPVRGQALTSEAEELSMNFIHQCHVMRIQIPEGRNLWGVGVRKLRVEFPRDVVGTMTADMAAPTAPPVLTEGSATVTAVLSEPLHESEEDSPDGAYVWLFLCPGQVSGTVRFTAYDANGYQSGSLEVEMDRMLEAGRITPVNLTVPQELPVAWIDLSVTGNNLGEEPERFTVRAPEGAKFRNGTDTCSFEINSQNSYRLCYYDRYDGIDNGALMKNGEFTFTYESASAVVSERRTVAPFPEAGAHRSGLRFRTCFTRISAEQPAERTIRRWSWMVTACRIGRVRVSGWRRERRRGYRPISALRPFFPTRTAATTSAAGWIRRCLRLSRRGRPSPSTCRSTSAVLRRKGQISSARRSSIRSTSSGAIPERVR